MQPPTLHTGKCTRNLFNRPTDYYPFNHLIDNWSFLCSVVHSSPPLHFTSNKRFKKGKTCRFRCLGYLMFWDKAGWWVEPDNVEGLGNQGLFDMPVNACNQHPFSMPSKPINITWHHACYDFSWFAMNTCNKYYNTTILLNTASKDPSYWLLAKL